MRPDERAAYKAEHGRKWLLPEGGPGPNALGVNLARVRPTLGDLEAQRQCGRHQGSASARRGFVTSSTASAAYLPGDTEVASEDLMLSGTADAGAGANAGLDGDEDGDTGHGHDAPLGMGAYCARHTSRLAPPHAEAAITRIVEDTRATFPNNLARQLCGPLCGETLATIVAALAAGRGCGLKCLELGTFTGYSAAYIVAGLHSAGAGAGSSLVTCERDAAAATIARRHLEPLSLAAEGQSRCRAAGEGVSITVHEGDALEYLHAEVHAQEPFDFVFVDANKRKYGEYYELLVGGGRLAAGGVAVFDNTLFFGDVVEAEAGRLHGRKGSMAKAVHRFNAMVHGDVRTRQVLLPVRDGMTIVRLVT